MLNKGILLAGKEKLYNVYRGTVSHVSLSYSPQTDIKAGTRVNITVNANSGYQNPSVSVTKNDGTGSVTVSGSGSSRYFTMPKSDVTINASASLIPTYSVSGSASGGGISFSKTSGIRAGETVTVYLSPNSYYILSSLTSSPSVSFSGSGNTRTFKMPSRNVRITATFVVNYTHIITGVNYDSSSMTHQVAPPNYGSFNPSTFLGDTLSMLTTRKWGSTYDCSLVFDNYSNSSTRIRITRLDNNNSFVFSWEQSTIYGSRDNSKPLLSDNDINKTLYLRIEKI